MLRFAPRTFFPAMEWTLPRRTWNVAKKLWDSSFLSLENPKMQCFVETCSAVFLNGYKTSSILWGYNEDTKIKWKNDGSNSCILVYYILRQTNLYSDHKCTSEGSVISRLVAHTSNTFWKHYKWFKCFPDWILGSTCTYFAFVFLVQLQKCATFRHPGDGKSHFQWNGENHLQADMLKTFTRYKIKSLWLQWKAHSKSGPQNHVMSKSKTTFFHIITPKSRRFYLWCFLQDGAPSRQRCLIFVAECYGLW